MSLRLNTAARNKILNIKPFRKIFEGSTLRIYTGSQPSSADTGATGTLLVSLTVGSATITAKSTRQVSQVKVSTLGAEGDTYSVIIDGTAYTYTQIGGDTVHTVAQALSLLVDESPSMEAIAGGSTYVASTLILLRSRFGGVSAITVSVSCTGTASLVAPETYVSTLANYGLQFGSAVSGVISKNSAVWSGSAVAGGVAGWFRLSEYGDTPTSDSTSYARLDGSIAASGGDMTMGNTTVQSGATVTIDSAAFTEPTER